MIRVSKASKITHHVKKRSATMTVERLGPTKFRVKPSEKGKVVRVVDFLFAGDEGIPEARIDCYQEGTLKSCDANIHDRMCSHAFSAIKMLLGEEEEREPEMKATEVKIMLSIENEFLLMNKYGRKCSREGLVMRAITEAVKNGTEAPAKKTRKRKAAAEAPLLADNNETSKENQDERK